MERYIKLFGIQPIEYLLADSEFIGEKWIGSFNEHKIRYYIRIREIFWVDVPRTGTKSKALWSINRMKINQYSFIRRILKINGQLCYLSGAKVRNKDVLPELQLIISFIKPEQPHEIYKQRWQIEMAFKSIKSIGLTLNKPI